MSRKEILAKMKAYEKGEIKSKVYTEQEIKDKIDYFKNLTPVKSVEDGKISQKRWKYEIKRNTELFKTFKECPDWSFLRLEYISEYGL